MELLVGIFLSFLFEKAFDSLIDEEGTFLRGETGLSGERRSTMSPGGREMLKMLVRFGWRSTTSLFIVTTFDLMCVMKL